MIELHTPRLTLVAATLEIARAEVEDRATLATLLGARLPSEWPPPLNDDDSARFFLNYLTRYPDAVGWMAWYFILRNDRERVAIGNGGFKGEPVDGTVEIGYSILPRYQRRGFAGESIRALLERAFSHDAVRRVVAQTFPELNASQALLRKLGFLQIPSTEPGVLRFELEAPQTRAGPVAQR